MVFELLATHRQRIKTAIVGGAHPYAEDTSTLRGLPAQALVSYWEALAAPLSDESKKRIAAFNQQELADMIPDRIDKSGRLAGLDVRSLMICGTNDDRFEGMRRFAATDERCTFVPVRDADHLQAWFRSDQPASEVRSFLRGAIA